MLRRRTPLRLFPLVSLVFALGFPLSCQKNQRDGTTKTHSPGAEDVGKGRFKRRISLPDPLPLPDRPRTALHLANPEAAIDVLRTWAPGSFEASSLLVQALRSLTTETMAKTIGPVIDTEAPWSFAELAPSAGQHSSELIFRFPVRKDSRKQLSRALAGLKSHGPFGAVVLPNNNPKPPPRAPTSGNTSRRVVVFAPPDSPWLLWFDHDRGAISIAKSSRGLVTGRELAEKYGRSPVFGTMMPRDSELSSSTLRTLDPKLLNLLKAQGLIGPNSRQMAIQRVVARGSLQDLQVTATLAKGVDPLQDLPLAGGSLKGLLQDTHLAVGASGRWSARDKVVKDTIRKVQRRVDGLNFFVKGTAQELASKFYAVLRGWDGRLLAGLGPADTLRLAYGAKNPAKNGATALRLLKSAESNLALARSFVANIPSMRLKKNVASAAGIKIHTLVLGNIRGQLPKSLRALLDDKGRLRVALAWSPRAGAGLVTAGPRSVAAMSSWLTETKSAPPDNAASSELAQAVVSLSAKPMQSIMRALTAGSAHNFQTFDLSSFLTLRATGPRTTIALRRDRQAQTVSLRIKRDPSPSASTKRHTVRVSTKRPPPTSKRRSKASSRKPRARRP